MGGLKTSNSTARRGSQRLQAARRGRQSPREPQNKHFHVPERLPEAPSSPGEPLEGLKTSIFTCFSSFYVGFPVFFVPGSLPERPRGASDSAAGPSKAGMTTSRTLFDPAERGSGISERAKVAFPSYFTCVLRTSGRAKPQAHPAKTRAAEITTSRKTIYPCIHGLVLLYLLIYLSTYLSV